MKTAAWKSHDLLLGSGFIYRDFFSNLYIYYIVYVGLKKIIII